MLKPIVTQMMVQQQCWQNNVYSAALLPMTWLLVAPPDG